MQKLINSVGIVIKESSVTLMEEPIFLWMAQYAYEPLIVYACIVAIMFASSFGLPVPEEVTLISAGLIAYMGSHPEVFPPPYEGAQGVSVFGMMAVCYLSVLVSDCFIYFLGRRFGRKIIQSQRFERMVNASTMERIENWISQYGMWTCGVFRFTPGLRFPGHLAYGALGFPFWKFCVVDGTAALLSVPTQVFVIATYGETILYHFQEFKFILFLILGTYLSFYVMRWVFLWWLTRSRRPAASR